MFFNLQTLFYGGKDPIFNPKDPRIRSIPFATRRPTHSEVKRVHQELFSITLHGMMRRELIFIFIFVSLEIFLTNKSFHFTHSNDYIIYISGQYSYF